MQFDPRRSCRVWGCRHELLWPLLLFDYSLQSPHLCLLSALGVWRADSNVLCAASCRVSAVWVGPEEGQIKVIGSRSKIYQVQSELFMPPYQRRHSLRVCRGVRHGQMWGVFCALMSLRSEGDKWVSEYLTWPQVKNLTLLSAFNMFKVYLYSKRRSFEDQPVCGCSSQYGLVHD